MINYLNEINDYLSLEMEIIQKLDTSAINCMMNMLEKARLRGATVYICGNGGSASTASHFASDFNKGVSITKKNKYKFVCLSDNIAMMTSIANDNGYENIFEEPLHGRFASSDVLIAISGSGNSENVLRAVTYARSCGGQVITLTGYDGGKICKLGDININIPVDNMQITEDLHMVLEHMMMFVLSNEREGE